MKLPFKLRIVKYAIDENRSFTAADVYDALTDEYRERQCNIKYIESLLMTMLGIGVLKVTDNYFDKNSRLVTEYVITEFGKTYKSHIPANVE